MFLTFIIVFPLTQILLSALGGEMNYDIDIVHTLSLGFFMTIFMAWFRKWQAKKELEQEREVE